MNEEQLTRSERIASRIMRALAVVGLVSILALAAWLIVQGVRVLPNAGEGLGAAVTTVTSLFNPASEESVSFTLNSTTFASGDPATLSWTQVGKNEIRIFAFQYACVEGVTLAISTNTGWTELACNTPITLDATSATIIPSASKTRFNDVPVTISAGSLTDTRTITVINSTLTSALPTDIITEEEPTPVTPPVVEEKPVVKPVPAPTPRPVTPAVPAYRPADLSVTIDATGILSEVKGRDTFFEVSPIPSDKTGAVKFTVVNQGTVRSGTWTFIANLPTEGDDDYRYVSPLQSPLDGGASVEFTLGFDDVLEERTGTIRITLKPTLTTDLAANNTDSERIDIR